MPNLVWLRLPAENYFLPKTFQIKAVNDIQRGLMQLTDEVKDKLSTMQVNGEYKQVAISKY